MESAPRICVVGSSMHDQVTRAARLPGPGETLPGTAYHTGFGGKGANQAVMAARLGARVGLVARLGRDAVGLATAAHLAAEGIDITHVTFDDGLPSGVAPIWVNETTGQNSILIIPGANRALTPERVHSAAGAIRGASVVVGQLEIPVESTRAAFQLARGQPGVLTLLNPAPALAVPDELLRLTDLLVPNENEAAALSGLPVGSPAEAIAAARHLQGRGARAVVVTLGAAGAVALDDSGEVIEVTAPAVTAVDTTGAGDCFIGCLAVFLASGAGLRPAMERAAAIASISVTRAGTQTSYPRREELPPWAPAGAASEAGQGWR